MVVALLATSTTCVGARPAHAATREHGIAFATITSPTSPFAATAPIAAKSPLEPRSTTSSRFAQAARSSARKTYALKSLVQRLKLKAVIAGN